MFVDLTEDFCSFLNHFIVDPQIANKDGAISVTCRPGPRLLMRFVWVRPVFMLERIYWLFVRFVEFLLF